MGRVQIISPDFDPERMSDETYGRVLLTLKGPSDPNSTNTTSMAKAEKMFSTCVEKALESLVLVNKAYAKKNGIWLQFTEWGVPHIYFDMAVHKVLKRWIKRDSSTPIDLEVCVCNDKPENELLCLLESIGGNSRVLESPASGDQPQTEIVSSPAGKGTLATGDQPQTGTVSQESAGNQKHQKIKIVIVITPIVMKIWNGKTVQPWWRQW